MAVPDGYALWAALNCRFRLVMPNWQNIAAQKASVVTVLTSVHFAILVLKVCAPVLATQRQTLDSL
ncbi:MAG: hypothetical protein ACQCN6_07280 [Candidatus Bathyarchaeia archaeon]